MFGHVTTQCLSHSLYLEDTPQNDQPNKEAIENNEVIEEEYNDDPNVVKAYEEKN